MPPIDTSALAAIFTWVWDQYGKTIVDRAGKAVWERLSWKDRALAYGQKVQRLYGTMQILGQARPVPLEGVYTAVSLLDRPTVLGRYTVEEMEAEFVEQGSRYFHAGDKGRRRDGLEMVRGGENLFILGKPGAGKTTFLKHVALRGVNGDLKAVPIFIGLKQLSDSGLSVFDFVVNQFDVCDFPDAKVYLDKLLKEGTAILLFDGLDEVNVTRDEQPRLISDVEMFTWKYDKCQRLITCRSAASNFTFRGYTYVEMADFTQDEIRDFARNWYGTTSEGADRGALFLSELDKPESKGLQDLARVPLLLALICLAFEQNLKLSQRRAELYEEALDALLTKWDRSRNIRRDEVYRELTLKRKVQMLAQVAAETFDRSEYFIPRKTLTYSFESFLSRTPNTLEHIDGNVILSTIIAQHGLFQEPAREVFSFAHLTFHEYFAARYVTEYEAQGTVPQLMKHYADQRFREVFLLTAYQLHDTRGFFESFLTHLTEDAQRRKKLADLLRQATHKAFTASGKYCAQAVGRSIYIYLALNLAVAEDHALNLARDLEVERNRALDRARELNLFLDKALDEVRQIALDLHLISHHDLGRASEHFHSLWNSFGQAQQLAYHRDEVLYRVDGITQELAHIRAREQARDISLDLIRHLDTDLALGRALDCTLDRAFDCNLDLARSPHAQLARDISLVNARILINDALAQPNKDLRKAELITLEAFLETAKAQAGALDDPRMQENLSHLVGGIQRLASRWERLMVKDLRSELDTILKAAELVFPSLDDEDWSIVARYLDGNRLLLACLDQAAVPDREAIKDRLLLLPDA